jgi:hypothetical protein
MTTIPPHAFRRDVLAEKTDNTREFLESLPDLIPDRPDLLPTYARRAQELAAGIVAIPLAEDGVVWLRRSARASALLFANRMRRGRACSIDLGDSEVMTVEGENDPTYVTAPGWTSAMWDAFACNDALSQSWLCAVDEAVLSPEGVSFNGYHIPYFRFLRSLIQLDGEHARHLEDAIERCDADSLEVPEALEEMDAFDYPMLRACYQWLAGDAAGFEASVQDVLERHKRYWVKQPMAVGGLISTQACALRRLAAARGFPVRWASPLMPPAIWQAAPHPPVPCCPYCVMPMPDGAPSCAWCTRDGGRDAPLQLSAEQLRSDPKKPCSACGLRVHHLAVCCPRCAG